MCGLKVRGQGTEGRDERVGGGGDGGGGGAGYAAGGVGRVLGGDAGGGEAGLRKLRITN